MKLHNSQIISKPRITEKSSLVIEKDNAYVFNVADDATKGTIARAIKEIYNVKPVKVNITRLPRKQVFVRGKKGYKNGVKKAYVYLKKGDKIEFV
ncbi:MAG: 50S ribosomal protein L23 [Candidatus Paceibacterota bacterium]